MAFETAAKSHQPKSNLTQTKLEADSRIKNPQTNNCKRAIRFVRNDEIRKDLKFTTVAEEITRQ